MIAFVKLFYLNNIAMVALYSNDLNGEERWLMNLPAEEVVEGSPSALPIEDLVHIERASNLVVFTSAFKRRLKPGSKTLKSAELTKQISDSTGVPVKQVRAIMEAVLNQLVELIQSDKSLRSPQLVMRPRMRKPTSAGAADQQPRFGVLLTKQPPKRQPMQP